jgi:uncharacterized protein (DUF952 family)
MLVFKIVHAAEWRHAELVGEFSGSAKDLADGFLHLSNAEQVPATLAKYYAGMDDLVLVCVDAELLGAALKFEPSRDAELFPHLYGPLSLHAVRWAKPLRPTGPKAFELPPELAAGRR